MMFDPTTLQPVAAGHTREDLRLSELCVQLVIRGAAISLGIAALAVGALMLL
jgi:hypothetical protein